MHFCEQKTVSSACHCMSLISEKAETETAQTWSLTSNTQRWVFSCYTCYPCYPCKFMSICGLFLGPCDQVSNARIVWTSWQEHSRLPWSDHPNRKRQLGTSKQHLIQAMIWAFRSVRFWPRELTWKVVYQNAKYKVYSTTPQKFLRYLQKLNLWENFLHMEAHALSELEGALTLVTGHKHRASSMRIRESKHL